MKILITGANGYIGKRLILELLALGHELFCCVRDKSRFELTSRMSGSGRLKLIFWWKIGRRISRARWMWRSI